MLPVRGILERPVAQHCEPEGALAARRPFPHSVLRAPRRLRLLGGGQDRYNREAPHQHPVRSEIHAYFLVLGGPRLLRVGALESLLGGGGALRGSRSAAARRRVPGPAIVMARPGTLPGSPEAAHPSCLNSVGPAADSLSRRAVGFVGVGPLRPSLGPTAIPRSGRLASRPGNPPGPTEPVMFQTVSLTFHSVGP